MKDIDLNKLSREELIAYCKEKIVNFSNVDLNNKDLSEEEKVNLFKQQIDIIFHLTDVIEKDDIEIRELNLNINKLIKSKAIPINLQKNPRPLIFSPDILALNVLAYAVIV